MEKSLEKAENEIGWLFAKICPDTSLTSPLVKSAFLSVRDILYWTAHINSNLLCITDLSHLNSLFWILGPKRCTNMISFCLVRSWLGHTCSGRGDNEPSILSSWFLLTGFDQDTLTGQWAGLWLSGADEDTLAVREGTMPRVVVVLVRSWRGYSCSGTEDNAQGCGCSWDCTRQPSHPPAHE